MLSLTALALRFYTVWFIHDFFIVTEFDLAYQFFFFLAVFSSFSNFFKLPQMSLKVLLLSLLMGFLLICFWNLFLSYLPTPQMVLCLILNSLFSPPFFRNSLFFIASLITVLACLHSCISQPSLLPNLLTVLPDLLIHLWSIKHFSNLSGFWLFILFIYFYFQLFWPCLTAPLIY